MHLLKKMSRGFSFMVISFRSHQHEFALFFSLRNRVKQSEKIVPCFCSPSSRFSKIVRLYYSCHALHVRLLLASSCSLFIFFLLSKDRLVRSSKCPKREEERRDLKGVTEVIQREEDEVQGETKQTFFLFPLDDDDASIFFVAKKREKGREECGVLLMLESFSS